MTRLFIFFGIGTCLIFPCYASLTFNQAGNHANHSAAGITVLGNPPQRVKDGLNDAIASWNASTCNEGSDDFPQFLTGSLSAEGNITLEWHGGQVGPRMNDNSSLPTVCAEMVPVLDGSNTPIELYEYRHPGGTTGITQPCYNSRGIAADSIAHELGHYLGLGEAACFKNPAGQEYIMGPRQQPRTVNGLVSWDASRAVRNEECNAADANNVPPNEPEQEGSIEGELFGSTDDPNDDPCSGDNCDSPIVLDLGQRNFWFVALGEGVAFDLDADGRKELISWTDPLAGDGFLALDRNMNGSIDHGRELFGSLTNQIPSMEPNGFLALALFDRPSHGGNLDNWISNDDAFFDRLLIWRDSNQDGVSQGAELSRLGEVGIVAIGLDHKTLGRRDQHGNLLRWFGTVLMSNGKRTKAVDVIFQTE